MKNKKKVKRPYRRPGKILPSRATRSVGTITGNTGSNQLPMKKRMANVLAKVREREKFGIRQEFIEAKVLASLLKAGLVKKHKSMTWGTTTHIVIRAMEFPDKVEKRKPEPYAKRIAACQEAGMHYRGKNRGNKRIDPRVAQWEREKEQQHLIDILSRFI